MSSLRRRPSRRIVKTTFDDCFEYDTIPGFRFCSSKRSSSFQNRSIAGKAKIKQESTPKAAKTPSGKNALKPVNPVKKLKSNDDDDDDDNVEPVITRTSEKLKRLQNKTNLKKGRNVFMGTDYKRLKSQTSIQSKLRSNVASIKNIRRNTTAGVQPETTAKPKKKRLNSDKSVSSSMNSFIDSKVWQPVVHLKKLNVSDNEPHQEEHQEDKLFSEPFNASQPDVSSDAPVKMDSASQDSALSCSGTSSDFSEDRTSKGISEKKHASRKRRVNKTTSKTLVREKASKVSRPASDSALDDWPDEESDELDSVGDTEGHDSAFVDNLPVLAPDQEWSSPHMEQMMHWQEHLNFITSDLKSSFESLKSVIEEKNYLISCLKKKLRLYNGNIYHKILDQIILDYDEHDDRKPASAIIHSILKYADSLNIS